MYTEPIRQGRRNGVSADDVLATFSVYQPKTIGIVAADCRIDRETAETLLTELERRKELTRARGSTDSPVWIRRYRAV